MLCYVILQLAEHLIVRISFLFSIYYCNVQPKTLQAYTQEHSNLDLWRK
jgi:hypothetical protein